MVPRLGEDTEGDRDRETEIGISIPIDRGLTQEADHVLEVTRQDQEPEALREEAGGADGETVHRRLEAQGGEEVHRIVAIRATVTGVGVGVEAGMGGVDTVRLRFCTIYNLGGVCMQIPFIF